ncbi:MAG TPA: 3-deoxy-manno-octulosonate cytidylyltransferase [Deltaproteobacteria bacterium]|jgi:3-deoxy-manno-octulosonate cytidylyltransferase (CMP-KDO synthetase)|nr:MAG: 3-deoxy-manno-octulosonate cytidylyltransferase [Deltaproteobacteria bacterium ADurb.Bin072]HNQ86389.1 3-deoxy-manno-octulosonate cytidylyltransferase [Deltaproteobacteria bacterium]HRW79726.1 3-deoxy-manno-octulosonate cytidylyltransferase [Desulfomonilia bacterium]HOA45496.1 3-deoxy-manno-octulosonate cytidylyltransferase [Deltaproteobacteria bacterium]HOC75613.1 3-deoxy-manno-octulosonate cytidylyltransferase [Deltaproteobacteria bacterium]
MSVVAVIPARYASSRFPGKPLVDIAGKPMVRRIYEQVQTCPDVDRVLVATDDERIEQAVLSFGGRVVMTSPECPSGTDRVAQAVKYLDEKYIVNVQGDQVVLDLDALSCLVRALKAGAAMATIATALASGEEADPNCVKVVCAVNGDALYFSRSAIPFVRNPGHSGMLKHIGIYGFAVDTLRRFTSLEPTPLERTESLEQLRALESGIPIKVIIAHGAFHEINTPTDLERLPARWPAS